MTIDELARAAGLTARNVRAYQERGLLHPPVRVGRTGRYDASHLERLELIGRLLERGFSLAAIGSLLESWHQGQTLAEVLGLGQALSSSWTAEPVAELTLDELAAKLPGTPRAVADAVRAGIIDPPVDGRVLVRSPRSVELAELLHGLGIPVDALAAESVALRHDTDVIADRLMTLFLEHMWRPYAEAGRSSADYERLVEAVEALRTVPADMVVTMLAQSLRRRLEEVAANAAEEDRGITQAAVEA
jgi:DNA-binding transcriptional MerR regulator